jgi:hypothetical protein
MLNSRHTIKFGLERAVSSLSEALTWLETALEIHDQGIILPGDDRFLDPLRDEPRL